jgi:HAD superfamily hydrolase (TIGR01509 family)
MNRGKIKAIAFDLVGVLLKEKNYTLSSQEQILEQQLGNINPDCEFYSWATEQLKISQSCVEQMVQNIILNIYELKDPEIFSKILSEFPSIKLAIASNHISEIKIWLNKKGLLPYFHTVVISGEVGVGKPDPKFYEILVRELGEKPYEILLIDDNDANIDAAREFGLLALQYDGTKDLLTEIKSICNKERTLGTSPNLGEIAPFMRGGEKV